MRDAVVCRNCRGLIFDGQLSCSKCRRFLHADRLKELVEQAADTERTGDPESALASWREALTLLPGSARQYDQISRRIADLEQRKAPARQGEGEGQTGPSGKSWFGDSVGTGAKAGAAGLTGLALLVWKFKFIALFALTKATFLLFGLSKASTFLSMFLAIWAYTLFYGWKFAVGLVLSIYLHEMGHVAALMRYGIKPESLLFVPFVGAAVRYRQTYPDPARDARIAMAGPLWGLSAAALCMAVYLSTSWRAWGVIGWVGAEINLLNLMPIWIFDGRKAFDALSRNQRWLAVLTLAISWSIIGTASPGTGGWLFLVMLVAGYQAWFGRPAFRPDSGSLWLYMLAVVGLSGLLVIPLPPGVRG